MSKLSKEPFYDKLTSKTIREVQAILKFRKIIYMFKFIEYLVYTLSLILLAITLPAFFNDFSINDLFNLLILFTILYFVLPVIKSPQNDFISMKDDLRDSLREYTCTCTKPCSCKNDLKLYLKKEVLNFYNIKTRLCLNKILLKHNLIFYKIFLNSNNIFITFSSAIGTKSFIYPLSISCLYTLSNASVQYSGTYTNAISDVGQLNKKCSNPKK